MSRSFFGASILATFLLFCMSAVYFADLGPWRAFHSANSYDFASIYGAARTWLNGQNPYDMRLVTGQVHRAGDDPARLPNVDPVQPSVYLPTALPVVASIAWLRWEPARLLWSCLSTAAFVVSLSLLFLQTNISSVGKWLLAAGVFSFSPTFLGLSHGNPSVLSCGLTMLAVYLVMNDHIGFGALALGLAHCLKPQISIAAVVLFALWGCWRALLLSFVFPAATTVVSVLQAPSVAVYGQWLMSFRQALAAALSPGSVNDPSPENHWAYSMVNTQPLVAVWIRNPALVNVVAWLIAGVLAVCYLMLRRGVKGDRRLRDMAFFSALTLTIVYHRFYDEQLLLMVVPFLIGRSGKREAMTVALWLCLMALWFPLHVLSEWFSASMPLGTPLGVLLLRPQPVIILATCLLLIPWRGVRT